MTSEGDTAKRVFEVLFGLIIIFIAFAPVWVATDLLWGFITGGYPFSMQLLSILTLAIILTYGLLVLAYRMITGRGRKKDGGLVGPMMLRVLSVIVGVFGGIMVYRGFTQGIWGMFLYGIAWIIGTQYGFMLANKRARIEP